MHVPLEMSVRIRLYPNQPTQALSVLVMMHVTKRVSNGLQDTVTRSIVARVFENIPCGNVAFFH
jgi:hypothetical protein